MRKISGGLNQASFDEGAGYAAEANAVAFLHSNSMGAKRLGGGARSLQVRD